jgi:hypothetical protein
LMVLDHFRELPNRPLVVSGVFRFLEMIVHFIFPMRLSIAFMRRLW